MLEQMIVKQCSPTLAGIKTANLFSYKFKSREILLDEIGEFNRSLSGRGIYTMPMRIRGNLALIYTYRPVKLKNDLNNERVCRLLYTFGYKSKNVSLCVAQLVRRLKEQKEFPHEIGLFLGYPPEDVEGFINHSECKFIGCWKVYGDEQKAKKCFESYKKCTQIYNEQYLNGKPIERLIK